MEEKQEKDTETALRGLRGWEEEGVRRDIKKIKKSKDLDVKRVGHWRRRKKTEGGGDERWRNTEGGENGGRRKTERNKCRKISEKQKKHTDK